MFRRLAPVIISVTFALMIGLVSIMALAMPASPSFAQTNIDQGKSPAELFANDCAACHKTTRGLANGRNSLTLSIFLREHYTASRDQAAALAAYVLNSGGNAPAPKPTARVEEPKNQDRKGQEAKGQEPKAQEPKAQEPKETRTQEPKVQEARTPPPTAPQEPASTAATPAEPKETSGPTTSAATPTGSEPSENAPVPRDNIPD